MRKTGYLVFIIFCFTLLALPFAGMVIPSTSVVEEKQELSEFPQLMTEEGLNVNYLGELGDYFQDHFAFRQQMVSANAVIQGKIFGASTTDQVLIGKNNWMYYPDTLDDYLVRNVMTDRGIDNAVHNLKMAQDYVESKGSEFLLTIAPNKNSIYDENMPYYYQKGSGENNYQKLREKMAEAGIYFVDLHTAFEESNEILYLERDSHWSNKGAVLAYNTIMQQTDKVYETYANVPYEVRKEHLGDLTELIYPLNSELENNQYYQKTWTYAYVGDVEDNMADWIETVNPSKEDTLLMYRDSFGESLLPFFAEEFENAYFSRLVPYNLTNVDTYAPDYTIIERVERRIASFAEEPPIMQAPLISADYTGTAADNGVTVLVDTETSINLKGDGGYYVINGLIDANVIQKEDNIYVRITETDGYSAVYKPFHVSVSTEEITSDYGYMMYLEKSKILTDDIIIEILCESTNETVCVNSKSFSQITDC